MFHKFLTVAALVFAGHAQAADPCADYVLQPKPQNVGRDIVGQEMDMIQDQGHMLFAVYENYPPYSWEEKGKPRGVDIEIAQLIAEDLGVEAHFNFVSAGENLEALDEWVRDANRALLVAATIAVGVVGWFWRRSRGTSAPAVTDGERGPADAGGGHAAPALPRDGSGEGE